MHDCCRQRGASTPAGGRSALAGTLGLATTALSGAAAIATAWRLAPLLPPLRARGLERSSNDSHALWPRVHELLLWLVHAPRAALALDVLRGGLWLVGAYLCLSAALIGAGRLDPSGHLGRLAQALTPERLRRLAGMGTLALAGAVGTVPLPHPVAGAPAAAASIRAIPIIASPRGPGRSAPAAPREAMRHSTPAPSPVVGWVVQPGQSFWAEAEALVERASEEHQEAPSPRSVATCWLKLEHLDRDRLVRPGDFDLIEPGQVLKRPRADRCGQD